MPAHNIKDQVGDNLLDQNLDIIIDALDVATSFYPAGWESQVGVWRRSGKHARTGKRYRIYRFSAPWHESRYTTSAFSVILRLTKGPLLCLSSFLRRFAGGIRRLQTG